MVVTSPALFLLKSRLTGFPYSHYPDLSVPNACLWALLEKKAFRDVSEKPVKLCKNIAYKRFVTHDAGLRCPTP
jgi:hypothetical protein